MKKLIPLGAIVLLIGLLGGAFYFWQVTGRLGESGYQAVFLTNGQVYFGKVANQQNTWIKLTDIYYLQSRDSLQNQNDSNSQQDVTLVKLGQELHGPTDQMQILRDHVLFIEDLAEDSKVVQAIKDHQLKK